MARPSDARSRLVRVAAALFRQRGYDGVGLTEILEASGAPKGSFYHHFPEGKEQLAEAAVQYAAAQISNLLDEIMGAATDFPAGLRTFVAAIADWFERSGFREGCPITAVAIATVPQSPRLTVATAAAVDEWGQYLHRHAARLGTPLPADAVDRLLMLVEGGWLLARLRQSRQPLLDAAEAFLALR